MPDSNSKLAEARQSNAIYADGFEPLPFDINKLPFMPLYARDFGNPRVRRMTPAQVGIYTLLLCQSWIDDGLPDDHDELGMIVGLEASEFAEHWTFPLSTAWVKDTDGKLRNIRQERTRSASLDSFNAKRYAGWARHEKRRTGTAPAPIQQCSSTAPAVHEQSTSTAPAPLSNTNQTKPNQTKGLTPQTPLGGGLASEIGEEWSGALSALGDVAPGTRFARRLPETALSLAISWQSTGKGPELLRRTTERYRRLDGQGRKAPTLDDLERHSAEVLREVMATVPVWTRAVEMARTGAPGYREALERMGADFEVNEREWPPGIASKWKRCRAMELIETRIDS